jgi:hypothetical protein
VHRSAISTRKGGGFYGYKVHAAVCTTTGLPVAWTVTTASQAEVPMVRTLLDTLASRGIVAGVAVLDKGYDATTIYDTCEARGIRPIIPLRQTPGVKAGKHLPPSCEHGVWTFAGSDTKARRVEVALPDRRLPACLRVGQGRPAAPAHPANHDPVRRPVPPARRGRTRLRLLKHEWAMLPLRVRRLPRVRLHVDLTILARLATRPAPYPSPRSPLPQPSPVGALTRPRVG